MTSNVWHGWREGSSDEDSVTANSSGASHRLAVRRVLRPAWRGVLPVLLTAIGG
jgi:hypothetical protein